jgi:tRNA modification GTPase
MPGPATQGSVAIIRVSGSDAVQVAARMFRPGGKFRFDWRPESHRVYYGKAVDGDEVVIDEVGGALLLLLLRCWRRTRGCQGWGG